MQIIADNRFNAAADISTYAVWGKVTVIPSTAAIGDNDQVNLQDWPSDAAVSGITLAGVAVTLVGSPATFGGEATFNTVIPNGVPTGRQSLTVTFDGSGNRQANITITGAPPPSPTPLPFVT